MTKNILLVGVGGQGTITAAKLLTTGLMEAGYDVKMSEIHGMSQRGGSVSSQVRYGEKVESPVIELGTADLIVAFEKMEAMRYLNFLRPEGVVVVSENEIWPLPVVIGGASYPEGLLENIASRANTRVVDASHLAESIGNPKVANVILLGTVIKYMGLEKIDWEKIIRENVKPAFIDVNVKALFAGMEAV